MESKSVVISLCDESGVMVRPWSEAGFTCYCVDTAHSIRRDRVEGNIHYVWGDVRSWTPPPGVVPRILFGFSPCTDLTGAGARDWPKKSWPLLRDGVDLFMAQWYAAKWARCPFMLENPRGRLPTYIGHADQHFDPCNYGGYLDPPGDAYTKDTRLWTGNGFEMPEPRPVEPVEGSKMHKMPPGPDRQKLRSQTRAGFARAVFEANRQAMPQPTPPEKAPRSK